SPRSTAPRCETCCPEFCSPSESSSEIRGRCGLPRQRTTRRPARPGRQRYSRAFRPRGGSCERGCCPLCSLSAGRHPGPEWPGTPLPDRSRLEGRSCSERLYRLPRSFSRSLPPEEAGSAKSQRTPSQQRAASTSSLVASSSVSSVIKLCERYIASEYPVNCMPEDAAPTRRCFSLERVSA